MRKTTKVLATALVLGTLAAGGTATADPVDDLENAVGVKLPAVVAEPAVIRDVKVPGGGGPVAGGGLPVAPPRAVNSAVVGYIQIVHDGTIAASTTTYALFGALSDPNQWSCAGGGGTTSYSVTCSPVTLPVNVNYTCQVLHADVNAVTAGSSGRTIMDCNSDGIPEAQTGQKIGPGGYDFVWATSGISVTQFTCTLDLMAPLVRSGCGDPGLVTVE